MIHDHGLYEHILDDRVFFGAVGMLECTSLLSPRATY
jgi:hypothetical protein